MRGQIIPRVNGSARAGLFVRSAVVAALAALAVLGTVATATAAGAIAADVPDATDSPDHGVGEAGRVDAIAQANGRIYIGGRFTIAGGQSRNRLMAIDAATGELDTRWNPNANNDVHAVAVAPDGSAVYVGGVFSHVGGQPRARIAKLDPVTGDALPWNPGASANVRALAVTADTVYAGGLFTTVGGASRAGLAALDAQTGAVIGDWRVDADPASVRDLHVSADGSTLYVAGNFDTLAGLSRPFLASVDAAAGSVSGWRPTAPFQVFDLALSPDGDRVYTAGGGPMRNGGNMAGAYSTSQSGQPLWERQADGDHQAIAATRDTVYTGGHFNFVGGVRRNHVLAFDSATGALQAWNPGANSVYGIWALETNGSGLLAGGDFTVIGGRTQPHFAKFSEAGTAAPNATFTFGCLELRCDFDASGSSDPDGTLADYEWSFGDGGSGSGTTATHEFAAPGTYTVTLTVTDNDGSTDATSRSVGVTAPGDGDIAFRAAAGANGNAVQHQVTIPPEVRGYDALLLFASANVATATFGAPDGVTGWTHVDTVTSGSMQTTVWKKVAVTGDAGQTVTLTTDVRAKVDLSVLAYSGTDASDPVAGHAAAPEDTWRASHTTPSLTTGGDGAAIVSYWADKTSGTTAWTPPTGEQVRYEGYGGGGGRVAALATDRGRTSATGTYGGLTATADAPTDKATMWTIALAPAGTPVTVPSNAPPEASFGFDCADLVCGFEGSSSSDADGTLTDYAWSFGDGGSDTGANVSHAYAAAGTYRVELTVTDDDGVTDTAVRNVTVGEPAGEPTIAFRAAASANGNAVSHGLDVPASVEAGDGLLLFASVNRNDVSIGDPTGVAGWEVVDTIESGTMQTRVWRKAAVEGDAGQALTVTLGVRSKTALTVLAYAGTDPADPVAAHAAAAEDTRRAEHTTPALTTAEETWIVSYWADKTSATSEWTAPAGEVVRAESYGDAAGRIAALATDYGAAVPAGDHGGLTATADSANAKATMWTLALKPAPAP